MGKYKQFDYHKLNATGDKFEEELCKAFDAFVSGPVDKILGDAGKKHRCHGIMLEKMEEALNAAIEAMTARGDLKS